MCRVNQPRHLASGPNSQKAPVTAAPTPTRGPGWSVWRTAFRNSCSGWPLLPAANPTEFPSKEVEIDGAYPTTPFGSATAQEETRRTLSSQFENPFDADVGEHHHSVQGGIHRWSGPNHLGLKGNECRITRVGRSRGQTQPRRSGIRHTSVLDFEAVDDRGHREVPTECRGGQEQQPLPVHLAQPSQRKPHTA